MVLTDVSETELIRHALDANENTYSKITNSYKNKKQILHAVEESN